MNVEIIRNTLYKAYLEDFYKFCKNLGGKTAEVMCEILAVRFNLVSSHFCLILVRGWPSCNHHHNQQFWHGISQGWSRKIVSTMRKVVPRRFVWIVSCRWLRSSEANLWILLGLQDFVWRQRYQPRRKDFGGQVLWVRGLSFILLCKSILTFLGQAQHSVVFASIPLWRLLCIYQTEGTRNA